MEGKILSYDQALKGGLITGNDGKRYRFTDANWQATMSPQIGRRVDFVPEGETATAIYTVAGPMAAGEKNKIVAAVLAFFLGWLGVHKFYLGYKKQGIIMAVIGGGGSILPGLPTRQ